MARYYDPATAQFLTVDPKVAATLSPYGYVAGDPLNATDALGLCSWNPLSNDSCEIAVPGQAVTSALRTADNDVAPLLTTIYEHATISYGGCFYICVTGTVQDSDFSLSVGCCGMLARGYGLGWASETPTPGWNGLQYMIGGGYIAGGGATVT